MWNLVPLKLCCNLIERGFYVAVRDKMTGFWISFFQFALLHWLSFTIRIQIQIIFTVLVEPFCLMCGIKMAQYYLKIKFINEIIYFECLVYKISVLIRRSTSCSVHHVLYKFQKRSSWDCVFDRGRTQIWIWSVNSFRSQ